jgi:hypothetical protein
MPSHRTPPKRRPPSAIRAEIAEDVANRRFWMGLSKDRPEAQRAAVDVLFDPVRIRREFRQSKAVED